MAEINLVPIEYREKKERWKKVFSKTTFFMLFLVILSIAVYVGSIFYNKRLNANLELVKQEIVALENKREPEKEKDIIDLDTRMSILKEVFEKHTYWSNVFKKIEGLVMHDVYFSDGKLTLEPDKVSFQASAVTSTYTSLAKQMLAFQNAKLSENEPLAQKIEVSNISLSEEGGIKFVLSVSFPLKILLTNSETKAVKTQIQ